MGNVAEFHASFQSNGDTNHSIAHHRAAQQARTALNHAIARGDAPARIAELCSDYTETALHEAAGKWQHDMFRAFLEDWRADSPNKSKGDFVAGQIASGSRFALREFGSVMSEERLQIISDWLVENRNSNQFSQDPNLPALRNALLDGKITMSGGAATVKVGGNAPRMMTKGEELMFCLPPLGTPLIIGFTEMGASEQQDENNTTMLIVDTPARKTIGDKRVEYAHQNEWLYNRTGLSTDEGVSRTDIQEFRTRAANAETISLAAFNAAVAREPREGIDDTLDFVGLEAEITRTETPLAD